MADKELTENDVDALFGDEAAASEVVPTVPADPPAALPAALPADLGIPEDDEDVEDEEPAAESASISFADLAKVAAAAKPDPPAPKISDPAPPSEGEDSGLADILAVAASLRQRPSEASQVAPAAHDATHDDDELIPNVGAGFGGASAVAVVEVKSAEPAAESRIAAAPVGAAAKSDTGGGGAGKLAIAAVVIAAIGGVGYLWMSNDQGPESAPVVAVREAGPRDGAAVEVEPEAEAEAEPEPEPEPEPDDGTGGELLAMADGGDTGDAADSSGLPVEPTGGEESSANGSRSGSAEKSPSKSGKSGKSGKSDKSGGAASEGDAAAEGGEGAADQGADEPVPVEDAPVEDAPVEKGNTADVDCLLNPELPGCTGKKKVVEKQDEGPALPDKLSQTSLRTGFESVKPAAKQCGEKNKIASGTKVTVKVSIEGSTGKVLKATALDEHANTSVGRCIESAVKQATFDKFDKSQMGITWPFKL